MADAAPVAPAAPVATATPEAPADAGNATEAPSKGSGSLARGPDGKFQSGSAPPANGQKTATAPEVYELKINGKTERLTKEQLILRAQKVEAIEDRFREAAKLEAKAKDLLAMLETDPEAALSKLGKDPQALFEKVLARKAEEAQLTPEQREALALKRERDEAKKELEALRKEKQEAAQKAADERTAARLEETLLKAAESYGLDKTPETLQQLTDLALEYIELGVAPTADQLCQELLHKQREFLTQRDQKILKDMDPDKLAEYLGQETIEKLQKASLKAIPKPGAVAKPKEPREKTPEKGYLDPAEFDRMLGLRK